MSLFIFEVWILVKNLYHKCFYTIFKNKIVLKAKSLEEEIERRFIARRVNTWLELIATAYFKKLIFKNNIWAKLYMDLFEIMTELF